MPITECPTCEKGITEDIELEEPDSPEPKCECSECDLRTLGEMESPGMSRCECSECDLRTLGEMELQGMISCDGSECNLKTMEEMENLSMSSCEYIQNTLEETVWDEWVRV